MKNIHILPTTEKSRLHYYFELNKRYALSKEPLNWRTAHHVYITSDEVIHYSHNTTSLHQAKSVVPESIITTNDEGCWMINSKKIILTTDQDLIEDGVQEIDNEFLEWFVKNPTCEFVEVQKWTNYSEVKYKLIIPQEEPKQDWYCPKCKSYVSSESVTFEEIHQICNTSVIVKEEPKQETLEEAAKEFYPPTTTDLICSPKLVRDAFVAGSKYMAERMHSEQIELINWLQQSLTSKKFYSTDAEDLIEQFKKK
jgi:hypothetical protein